MIAPNSFEELDATFAFGGKLTGGSAGANNTQSGGYKGCQGDTCSSASSGPDDQAGS
jgi:hypothetical protein